MALQDARRHGSLWGMQMKHVSLVALTIQNTALILILYYSRIMPLVGGQRYLFSTVVFLNEVVKLGICLTAALYEMSQTLSPSTPASALFRTLTRAVFTGDSWKLAIPASLYTLQNTLQYVAISNLDAATMQVTYQFKILPTALFSVLILQRSLSGRKWTALGLLMLGVAIVQIPFLNSGTLSPFKDAHTRSFFSRSVDSLMRIGKRTAAPIYKRSATYEGIEEDFLLEHPPMNAPLGLIAALTACTVSALASVYFEKVLKESNTSVSIWVRNVQLSFYSLFPALFIGVLFVDGENISKAGFFAGYNWIVWMAVFFQAFGGILVAICVHYTNTIAKSFATSISILLSLCASIYFFDFTLTSSFLAGTSLVVFSTYLYNSQERSPKPPPIRIHDYEKTTIDSESARRGEFLKTPTTPLKSAGLSTSRPGSPAPLNRGSSTRGYFAAKHRDE
ncbi:MAG: hypothetical protein MMC33_000095 [Icmadophila ericetorum]|nr:hypothetical protein [Icmadophila ericetorum]